MVRPSPEADFGVPSVGPATPTDNNSRNNVSFNAVVSQHLDVAVSVRPSYLLAGGTWVKDNGASPQELECYFFDGTDDILIYTIDVSANSIEFSGLVPGADIADQHISENAQVGTTYTTVLADDGKIITLNNASAIALTIPTNASVAYPIGTTIAFQQVGAGLVTMSGGGVTFQSRNGLVSGGQFAVWSITKKATNTWVVTGDLTA